jgi:hypothetical protein
MAYAATRALRKRKAESRKWKAEILPAQIGIPQALARLSGQNRLETRANAGVSAPTRMNLTAPGHFRIAFARPPRKYLRNLNARDSSIASMATLGSNERTR